MDEQIPPGSPRKQKLLKSIFETIADPMIVIDSGMRIQMVNTAALKYYGVPPETTIDNRTCYQALAVRSTMCRNCRAMEALATLDNICFERRGFFDPQRREQVTICPGVDAESSSSFASVRINDITQSRTMETELAHTDRMIALGVLLSGMAHEINNPVGTVLLNAQLLQKSWQSVLPVLENHFKDHGSFSVAGLPYEEMRHEIPDLLTGVQTSAKRIKQIIMDVKAFARKEDLQADEGLNINEIIHNSARLTQKLLKDTTDNFHLDLEDNLPLIKGNTQGMKQVMVNLIENACQAVDNPQQAIVITSKFTRETNAVVIEVSDQGRGMPDNIIDRIMEPFFTTRRESGGTGLGLSTSLNIIRSHGGTIRVNSRAKKGSSFSVILPLTRGEKKLKILIADDDPPSREIIKQMLEKSGRFDLKQAKSGADALVQMGQDPPDLLLLDIHMPGVDGADVCRVIQETPALSRIHVIVITGLINSETAQKVFAMGYEHLLEKPVIRQELLNTIHQVVEEGL